MSIRRWFNYDLGFTMFHPLVALKAFGTSAVSDSSPSATCCWDGRSGDSAPPSGWGSILGGIYLILRGFIRWEITVSFLAGILGWPLVHLMLPIQPGMQTRCSTCSPDTP